MRRAKESKELDEMIQLSLDSTNLEEIPFCRCPIYQFPEFMSTVFCTTKCYQACTGFRNFHFIVDACNNMACDEDTPCVECLEKIDEFKLLMRLLKAIFTMRMCKPAVAKRVRLFCKKSNGYAKKLQDWRERDVDD
jgi:hypothetical protein